MRISDYLKKEVMELDLKAQNKEDAVKELGKIICKSKHVINCDDFINDVFAREELCTTGIGNEIALPHARTDNVKEFVIAFGKSDKGVEFKSLDNKPVKLIFLMGTPQAEAMKTYLHILAHLTRLLQKEDFRKQLLNANRPAEIIETFKNKEE
ncbi:PTS sugar transporter subunit IIA [Elusimicrobiota bacterium]